MEFNPISISFYYNNLFHVHSYQLKCEDDNDHDELNETQPLLTHPSLTHDDYGAYEDDPEAHLDSPTFCETCLVTCMHYCDYVVTLNMLFVVIAASGAVLYLFTNVLFGVSSHKRLLFDFFICLCSCTFL
uniref:Uncharacterized protein n=1 Tax=Ditylenchus dipsaci TaxID=166011 RepID=A0A915D1D1_9BILA